MPTAPTGSDDPSPDPVDGDVVETEDGREAQALSGSPPAEPAAITRSQMDRLTRPSRTREFATLLPLVGAFFLVSPVILVFAAPMTVLGIPLILVYLFGVWALLIGSAALISRRLAREGSRQ